MQSFENSSMPTTKRLAVSLNVDTGYNGKRNDTSPPRTPAAQDPHLNKANIPVPNKALNQQRQTFLDDITPIDPASNKENDTTRGNQRRDSHDLSLSPRQITRDSLVDHMLLSLDQFSFGQEGEGFDRQPTVDEEQLYSSFGGDEEPYQPTSNFVPRGGRVGHTYSYSSDYDQADDASRYSGPSRGRRSNSSSNFQSGLGRINSLRNEGTTAGFVSNRAPVSIPPRGIHSRSGKGSKGSSANSFDLGYAQVTSNQRWAHGLAGRSSSFDYGKDRQSTLTSQFAGMSSAHGPVLAYDYDAAPTPTIPGGPRRLRPTSPVMTTQAQEPPSPVEQIRPEPQRLERKRSTKSSKSAYAGKATASLSNGGRLDYGLHDSTRELPPMPAFIREPAPAPLVGYGKAKDTATQAQSTQPPKDRPGFFRRVFGGSSRNNNLAASTPDPPPSHGSTTSTETTNRPSSRTHHIANQMKSHSLPPPREPPPPPKEHTHTLSKKPSSFFRRRKKSVAEPDPMPVPLMAPPVLLQNEPDGRTIPSPVSSLRKVMNPYLRTPARSPNDLNRQLSIDRQMDDSPDLYRSARGFSPDYEPDKSATIRAVRSNPRGTPDTAPSSSSSVQKPFLSVGPTGLNGTFLNDASDDGRSNASQSGLLTKEVPETELVRVNAPSPVVQASTATLVKQDMTLVAEYERAYSKNLPATGNSDLNAPSPTLESPKSHTTPQSLPQQFAIGSGVKDADWVMLTPTKTAQQLEKENRVWLEPSSDEEEVNPADSKPILPSPTVRSSGSTDAPHMSATSLPVVQIDGENESVPPSPGLLSAVEAIKSLDDSIVNDMTPTQNDREKAKKIYDGNEDFIQKERAAAWMGEEGPVRARTLVAYMELYEFSNLNILAALRILCGKLVLKAESQQVDRILDAFAQRWCQCNPRHGFKVTGRSCCLLLV
jgi:hypothetical protein